MTVAFFDGIAVLFLEQIADFGQQNDIGRRGGRCGLFFFGLFERQLADELDQNEYGQGDDQEVERDLDEIAVMISGEIMSATSEETILPNAPPMMIPTAMSMTFPRKANALNSCRVFFIKRMLSGKGPVCRDGP